MNLAKYIANRTFSSFRKSFTRSIIRLSIAATSLSLAVMIISQSIFNGFQMEIAKKVFGFWGHIHITDIQSQRSIEPITIRLTQSLKDSILNFKIPGETQNSIKHIQSFLMYPSIAGSKQEFEGLFLKAVSSDFDWMFFKEFLSKGRIIESNDTSYSKEILISEQTASRLNVDTGQFLILNFIVKEEHLKRKLKICGIYNTGLGEYDRKFALVDIKLLQQILHKDTTEITGIELFCHDILKSEEISNQIAQELLPMNWYSETIRQKFPNIFEWLSLQNVNKQFILFLILAVCIINMATTIMILILERTRMIGILTVMGMNRWIQRKIFIHFATRILFWSLVLGNLIGFGLCYIQYHYKLIKLSESDYYLSYAPVDLSILPILILNAIFFIVIITSLLLPSLIVQSIKPVQALKFR
ncbi:MAG: ABC transporter permease [Saprospiraceae bacterium]|nr:ABC transporter permease [Saprospiraceae bacterium]MBK9221596.1 ABC transporter permease [Saprospiraceae bacterium]MBK9721466.1 ABC transporter permease [Saprospiraceae bacterium]MBK9728531.1 ABC transporter permease [Saprospiraceae bacterium]